jgi:small multidrug resistance pump
MPYVYLMLAIAAEVLATTALKASNGFTRLGPTGGVVAGYLVAFYLLSLCLRHLQIGIVYAVWSAVGIVAVTFLGFLLYDERIDLPGLIGIGLIVAGVLVLHLFSRSACSI